MPILRVVQSQLVQVKIELLYATQFLLYNVLCSNSRGILKDFRIYRVELGTAMARLASDEV